ncbi:MAG: PEP-CTERM system histidine kinase PrsK, partial [Alphaproteobacteria bacterium]|nr:PEP-CTERM system histidine kinase PrsK [Alphaproteobacteria bacterium]
MLWETISLWGHVLASISFGVLVLWQTRQWFISHTGLSLVIAAAWTVIWALEVAILGNDALAARLAESVRDLAWLTYLMLLWRGHNRPLASYHAIRPLYWVSFGVLVLRIMVDLLPWQFLGSPRLMDADYYAGLMLRMVADIGGLVLVHNLYTAATSQSRNALRLPLAALALLWAYDLNANTIAYLARTQVYEMTALRGFILAPLPLLFLLGTMRAASAPVKLSRSATFQSLSLVAIGAYLVLMVGGSSLLRMFSEGAARGFQVSFAFLTALAALILLPNARLRAWSRVMLAKHFFQHRYDYRAEWLRFTNTLSRTDAAATSLDIRAIKAIADITESGAGLLLTPDASNGLIVRAQWNWPSPDAPTSAAGPQTLLYFQNTGRICALDAIRAGTATDEEAAAIPEWLLANNRAWVVVPLLHFSQLAGLVVLDRPMLDRELDWEDFDLLRLAGRQVASYLAEAQGQEALSDAQR